MLVAFAIWRGDFPVAGVADVWTQLPEHLDDLQSWLLDERTAEDPNFIFAIFDGFRALADWLVTALTDALEWLTWIGTAAAGTLLVWRFGGWRAGLIVLAAFVSFALMGLWEQSIQTLALMLAAVVALADHRHAARRHRRPLRRASTGRSRRPSTRCRSCRRSPT